MLVRLYAGEATYDAQVITTAKALTTDGGNSVAPTVTNARINYTTGVMYVNFSEIINASLVVPSKFHLNNVTGTDVVTLSAMPEQIDSMTLKFTLTDAQRVAAKAISGVTGGDGVAVVLDVDAGAITDMAGVTNLTDDANVVTEYLVDPIVTRTYAADMFAVLTELNSADGFLRIENAAGEFSLLKKVNIGSIHRIEETPLTLAATVKGFTNDFNVIHVAKGYSAPNYVFCENMSEVETQLNNPGNHILVYDNAPEKTHNLLIMNKSSLNKLVEA